MLPRCWTDSPHRGAGRDGRDAPVLVMFAPRWPATSRLVWQPAFQSRPLGVSLITESFKTVHKINIANRKRRTLNLIVSAALHKRQVPGVYYYPRIPQTAGESTVLEAFSYSFINNKKDLLAAFM